MTTRTQTTTPDRSLDQRLEALEHANKIRAARSELKRRVKADPTYRVLGLAIANEAVALGYPAGYLDTMKVADVILSAPKIGRVRVRNALDTLRVSPSKTIAGLSDRQRDELLAELKRPGTARRHPFNLSREEL